LSLIIESPGEEQGWNLYTTVYPELSTILLLGIHRLL
jgi:hypothetical protein